MTHPITHLRARLRRVTLGAALASALSAIVVACGGGGGGGGGGNTPPPPPAPQPSLSRGPTNSGPIQISADDKTVWVANPETNTVAAFNVAGDKKELLGDIVVGKEPRNLAISPDGKRVFVANAGENTLSVLDASAAPYAKDRKSVV